LDARTQCRRTKAILDGLAHQIAHHLAGHASTGRQPPHRLAIATVEAEEHLDRLSIPAADRKDIGAPAQIALEGDHHALMGALAPAAVARQQ
jgi:hypothetical protein